MTMASAIGQKETDDLIYTQTQMTERTKQEDLARVTCQ